MIQEILHNNYKTNSSSSVLQENLLMAVKKSNKLIFAQCLILFIEDMLFEKSTSNINDLEQHLSKLLGSEQQSFYDDIEIIKQIHNIRDGKFGDKVWSNIMLICPTLLHWMAILNDGRAIEVSGKYRMCLLCSNVKYRSKIIKTLDTFVKLLFFANLIYQAIRK